MDKRKSFSISIVIAVQSRAYMYMESSCTSLVKFVIFYKIKNQCRSVVYFSNNKQFKASFNFQIILVIKEHSWFSTKISCSKIMMHQFITIIDQLHMCNQNSLVVVINSILYFTGDRQIFRTITHHNNTAYLTYTQLWWFARYFDVAPINHTRMKQITVNFQINMCRPVL